MKKQIILLFLIFLGLSAVCQHDSCFHYKVEYEMHLNFSRPINNEASLYFNNFQSLFEYKEKYLEKDSIEQVNESDEKITMTFHDSTRFYIRNNKEQNLIREYFGNFNGIDKYEIEESVPTISWNLAEGTKKINQYNCNNANCRFRGRNYTVWFTTEIQTSFGPLKLTGLPGLILEVIDDTNEVQLYAKQIRKVDTRIKNSPSGLRIIPRAEYLKMIAVGFKKLEDVFKFMASNADRKFKMSYKVSSPKAIEMDLGF